MRLMLGPIVLWVNSVAIMKSFVGAASWYLRGTEESIAEYRTFRADFSPYLLGQPNTLDLDEFCDAAIAEVDAVRARHGLKSDLLWSFGWKLKNTLVSHHNRAAARRAAHGYSEWLERWEQGPGGELARRAVAQLGAWGVSPLRESLAATGVFGSAVSGVYVPDLRAVCVQLDVICRDMDADLNVIETLLHEQIHAVIHHHMGDDPARRELIWLNELAAVLTSQAALRNAGRALGDAERRRVLAILARRRQTQEYGALADAVLRESRHPLVPWHAWQAIAQLPADERRDYAVAEIIEPLLQRVGWEVRFPYSYGAHYVTCFRERSPRV